MKFGGRLSLAEGESLPATLRADDDFVAIDAASGQLGRWPLAICRLARNGDRFLMMLGEDVASFDPDDPRSLSAWVDARWPPLAESVRSAIAEKAVESPPPPARPEVRPSVSRLSLGQVALIGVAIVLGAVVVSALVARDRPSPNLLNAVPTTTTIPAVPAVFTHGVDQVTFAWNEASDKLGINLFLLEEPGPNRLQMNLAEGVTLYATEQPADGLVRTLMIAAGPTSSREEGNQVLAAWGILIAAVNPELDGDGRRRLLAELGVAPNRPLPNGIEAQATAGGALYELRSGVLGGRALLTVAPTG